MQSLREKIRQSTATTHAALERTPLMLAFAADSLSIRTYREYLLIQWRLHAPLEASIRRWLPSECAALRLRKSKWLRDDLQSIGDLPVESFSPADGVDSWAQAMGVLYVLEGSTLGLQVVRKRLQDKHPALQHAGRFMLGYGPDTGRHWHAFLAQFELVAEAERPLAEEAASATFTHFLKEFSRFEV